MACTAANLGFYGVECFRGLGGSKAIAQDQEDDEATDRGVQNRHEQDDGKLPEKGNLGEDLRVDGGRSFYELTQLGERRIAQINIKMPTDHDDRSHKCCEGGSKDTRSHVG